jgi:hypothetical protein
MDKNVFSRITPGKNTLVSGGKDAKFTLVSGGKDGKFTLVSSVVQNRQFLYFFVPL